MSGHDTPTYAIQNGDIIQVGMSYFRVYEVREPQDPRFPGLAFYGHYYSYDKGHWGPKYTPISALYSERWFVCPSDHPAFELGKGGTGK